MSTTVIYENQNEILFTATTTARSSGAVVLLNGVVVICKVAVAAAKTGAAFIGHTHKVTKNTAAGSAWTQLGKVYYDATAGKFTKTATNNTYAGRAAEAAAAAATTGRLILNYRES